MGPDPDALLAGLDERQREAVTCPDLPLLIVAGAGSGKTRVLTRRIAWRIATGLDDPRRVLALTFTRAAATELRQRLRLLGVRDGVRAGTFHSVAWAELRALRAERNRPAPVLLERPTRVLARLAPDGIGARAVAELANELAWSRARLLGPDEYVDGARAAGRTPPLPHHDVAELAHRYAEEKRRKGLVDFDDLLDELAGAMLRDPAVAATQRWRSTHLYVDEYQDLNPLQARLLEAWLGGGDGLCAVGDPNQAIYAWNGADPTLLERFVDHHPGAATVAIDRSYRSTPQVLAVANALLDAGGCGGVRLRAAAKADGPVPVVAGYVDDRDEGRAVARACVDSRLPGSPWSHQAVLARTNAQLDGIEQALLASGVPCRVRGRTPFAELPTVRAALRALDDAKDGFDAAVARLAGDDEADLDDDLARLLALADQYRAGERRPEVAGLRAWLAANADDGAGGDGVELRTFHAAKGLEWPVVHVCAVEDGFVPIAGARTPIAAAEERRLFYVALTRAERVLRVTWSAARSFGEGDPVPRRPSPYLLEVDATLRELREGTAPAPPPPALRPPAEPHERDRRAEALRTWRARRARAAGVAPSAVLADHVLLALVEREPEAPDDVTAVAGTGHLVAAGLVDEVLDALREPCPS